MAEDTETIEETTDPEAEETTETAPPEQDPAPEEAPAPIEAPASPAVAPPPAAKPPIDIDAELQAKETLADQLERGDITIEDYAKKVAKIDRSVAQAQRQAIQPVQQVIQQQEAARQYWGNWGKGQDVAQLQYGKTIAAAKAKALYQQAVAAIEANPRFQRPEYQNNPARLETIVTEKWIDSLAAEAKKPTPAARAPQQTAARVSGTGAGGGNATPSGGYKTAKQKLEDGTYDDELKRLAT